MTISRHPDWEERLAAVVADWQGRSYALGSADCGLFVDACVQAVIDQELWPLQMAYATEAGLAKALKRAGFDSLDAAATAALGPPLPPLMAHRGDVISDGQALGVMLGAGPAIFTHEGLQFVERADLTAAWAVGRAEDLAGPEFHAGHPDG